MIDFTPLVKKIKKQFRKDQLSTFNKIISFKTIKLSRFGSNDIEGYQIFTPKHIVKDMCNIVGNDILNFNKTILEPTSGDGAFTTYILQKRLETIKNNFEIESLKALSTIYSIEVDKKLIEKQRNNIFTLIKKFVEKNNIKINESYFEIIKCLITTNFIYAMFNIANNNNKLFDLELAYKMPEAQKKRLISLSMPVWHINKKNINYHEEKID